MKRRASLAISTNAIVVLIIAVIMLGLLVGLIQRAVGSVETKLFEKLASEEPDPPHASNSKPVTLSSGVKVVRRGESFALKVRFFNEHIDTATTEMYPGVKCGGASSNPPLSSGYTGSDSRILDNRGPIESITANARNIPQGDQHVYTLLVDLDNAAEVGKVHLCQVIMAQPATSLSAAPVNAWGTSNQWSQAPFTEFRLEVIG